ncbi:MAG: hypothetical protein R6W77_06980 [Trueperaceae bacterium]
MREKELYQQKMEAKLQEWKAEAEKLRAKAAGADADAKLEANRKAEELDRKIATGNERLAEIREAGEDTWDSVKARVDKAWDTLTSEVRELAGKIGR